MCGIIGINGIKSTKSRLIDALHRLEYRGYDSAGIACIQKDKLTVVKEKGKVSDLEKKTAAQSCDGHIGIAHTRWATHGEVSKKNAHPHATKNVAVVHNGIIENYQSLKKDLVKKYQIKFETDTDTEVILKYLDLFISEGLSLLDAGKKTMKLLKGSFSVIAMSTKQPDAFLLMRNGTPLGIGRSKEESFIGSDSYSISPFSNNITFLEDGDIAMVWAKSFKIYDNTFSEVTRKRHKIDSSNQSYTKGEHEHYMYKEMLEEPEIAKNVINNYIKNNKIEMDLSKINFGKIDKIILVACGTSFYAALTAKYWLESLSQIETYVEIASEYRSKSTYFTNKKTLLIFISQSGETADTLESLKKSKKYKNKIISITNIISSAIAREADQHFPIYAGPEIGVASTKAYINQLIVLALITLRIAEVKNIIGTQKIEFYINSLSKLPKQLAKIVKKEKEYIQIAKQIKKANSVLFIGRNHNFPTALEGALKLKELSYIHAEGIAAGELKHGSIALIDENTPLFAIAPKDEFFDKIVSNIQSVAARKGQIFLLSNKDGCDQLKGIVKNYIEIDNTDLITSSICYVIPLQFIAYHTALLKGNNVDQPRNLAKSVTV
ncbi:MAG: glutamine--fructose-6-phosphate transaminase (isomerizing), partial [Rickettsiales bacterium]